jgi:hypothetical protein
LTRTVGARSNAPAAQKDYRSFSFWLETAGEEIVPVRRSGARPRRTWRSWAPGSPACGRLTVCTSSERFYVDRKVADDFVEASKEFVESLNIGDPMDAETDIGPMINARAATRSRTTSARRWRGARSS